MYKYEDIAHIIEQKILNHEYQQGDRLPSILSLCQQYDCNKSTIIKCYETLIQKHLVYVKKQSGYYVADGLLKTLENNNEYALDTGNPIVSKTSLIDAKHCMSIAIDQYSESSLNISLKGVESLREALVPFLEQLAVYTKKEYIYLTQGITQMLSFFTMIDFSSHHRTILIEEPTYSYYIQFLKEQNINVLTIQRDENGIDLKELERLFQTEDIKFFYVVPRNHNPLGTTLSHHTRQKIAQLALQYHVYIIEDDYFGHCSSTPRYLPIYYFLNGQNCIYLTSFSKTIPYIRIGLCVIHPDFQDTLEKIIHQSYYYSYQFPSLISQATFEAYIRSSLYQKQSELLINGLKKNQRIIKKHHQQWDHHIAYIIGGKSGYYFSIHIHPDINLQQLQSNLLQHKIKIQRNERSFYNAHHFHHSIRLSLARIQPKELDHALKIFYQILYQEYSKIISSKCNNQ